MEGNLKCEECGGEGYVETYSLGEVKASEEQKNLKIVSIDFDSVKVDFTPIYNITKKEAKKILNQKNDLIYQEILKILREKAEE